MNGFDLDSPELDLDFDDPGSEKKSPLGEHVRLVTAKGKSPICDMGEAMRAEESARLVDGNFERIKAFILYLSPVSAENKSLKSVLRAVNDKIKSASFSFLLEPKYMDLDRFDKEAAYQGIYTYLFNHTFITYPDRFAKLIAGILINEPNLRAVHLKVSNADNDPFTLEKHTFREVVTEPRLEGFAAEHQALRDKKVKDMESKKVLMAGIHEKFITPLKHMARILEDEVKGRPNIHGYARSIIDRSLELFVEHLRQEKKKFLLMPLYHVKRKDVERILSYLIMYILRTLSQEQFGGLSREEAYSQQNRLLEHMLPSAETFIRFAREERLKPEPTVLFGNLQQKLDEERGDFVKIQRALKEMYLDVLKGFFPKKVSEDVYEIDDMLSEIVQRRRIPDKIVHHIDSYGFMEALQDRIKRLEDCMIAFENHCNIDDYDAKNPNKYLFDDLVKRLEELLSEGSDINIILRIFGKEVPEFNDDINRITGSVGRGRLSPIDLREAIRKCEIFKQFFKEFLTLKGIHDYWATSTPH